MSNIPTDLARSAALKPFRYIARSFFRASRMVFDMVSSSTVLLAILPEKPGEGKSGGVYFIHMENFEKEPTPSLEDIAPEIEEDKKKAPSEIGITNIDDFIDSQDKPEESEKSEDKPKWIN